MLNVLLSSGCDLDEAFLMEKTSTATATPWLILIKGLSPDTRSFHRGCFDRC